MSKTINIRGTLFEVDVETLEKMSYFKLSWETLILGFESKVINRCPDSFRHILDLLGYGIIDESLVQKIPSILRRIFRILSIQSRILNLYVIKNHPTIFGSSFGSYRVK